MIDNKNNPVQDKEKFHSISNEMAQVNKLINEEPVNCIELSKNQEKWLELYDRLQQV